jgi:glycosyltransferase involved in cell wall biosynthesis
MPADRDPCIVISALTLVPGAIGGSERYVRQLLDALSKTAFAPRLRVLAPPQAPELVDVLQGVVVDDYGSPRTPLGRAVSMLRYSNRPRLRAQRLLGDPIGGIHYPLTTHVPAATVAPKITSVLDVQHLTHPENFSRHERLYRRAFYATAIRRSALIITISHHAAQSLSETCGVPSDRIRVIHLGVDTNHFEFGELAKRENFLLYPAASWPHKNHARLFAAFRQLRRTDPTLELVLTGQGTETLAPQPGVRALGRVTDSELNHLYRTARAMVFPSLYEGFGMPIVEALACGCPVACSATTALPEIAGTCATYFDPNDVESIVEATMLCMRSATHQSTETGRVRAGRFSWDQTAALHVDAYTEFLA